MSRVMACPIQSTAQKYRERIGLYDNNQTLTYAQLDAMVTGTAAALQARGVVPGQVVAVLGRNSIEFAVVFFAALRYGFILMPLNRRLTAADRRRQVTAANCGMVIHDKELKAEAADLGITAIPIREVVAEDIPGSSLSSAIEIPLEREALIIFSSGSTGHPRGVVLTWGNLYFNALGSATFLPLGPEDIWLAVLPFFHIGGISILFRTALAACGAYVIPRFDAKSIIEVMRQNHISLISLVPTMLNDLLDEDGDNLLRNARGIILGGAAFDASLQQKAAAKRLPILTTYGMTETTSMVTLLDKNDRPDLWATAGRILPYREVMIADGDGKPSPTGERGRIMIRGEVVSRRYIGEPGTERLPDEWFDAGDVGTMDASGYLTVAGRQDSIIISGGESIDLTGIEAVLNAISGIKGAVVLSRADEKWGRRPVAFVELSGADFPQERIMGELAAQLPRFMLPDRIIIVRPLPLTASGKYDRIALQERYPDIFK